MTRLSYVALIERNVPDHLTGVTDLDIRENASGTPILYATSRSGEAVSVFEVGTGGGVSLIDHQSLNTDADHLEFMSLNGTDYITALGPQGDMPQLYRLNAAGQITGGATPLSIHRTVVCGVCVVGT